MKKDIENQWRVTEAEYQILEDKFGKYCHYIAWQLKRNNSKNNTTDDQEDIVQRLRIAMMRAASYYKRQTYIENAFTVLDKKVDDPFSKMMLKELKNLWKNRTRHGANRQKFGYYQEKLLAKLLKAYVEKKDRPDINAFLKLDAKFATYCKQIIWNEKRAMGKKITKEKTLRGSAVSLSDCNYLAYI